MQPILLEPAAKQIVVFIFLRTILRPGNIWRLTTSQSPVLSGKESGAGLALCPASSLPAQPPTSPVPPPISHAPPPTPPPAPPPAPAPAPAPASPPPPPAPPAPPAPPLHPPTRSLGAQSAAGLSSSRTQWLPANISPPNVKISQIWYFCSIFVILTDCCQTY